MPSRSMIHLNGQLLCAVDVETTGLIPGFHDLVQIAVLPLDSEINPLADVIPFYMTMKPIRPENIDWSTTSVTKLDLANIMLKAPDSYDAAHMFVEWFEDLNLPLKKRIAPLASNWIFDSGFIKEWLGPTDFESRFHFHYRDTQPVALFMNDRADKHQSKLPFSRVSVKSLGNHFDIVNLQAHDALQDCVTTAEIYKRMLTMFTPVFPGAQAPRELTKEELEWKKE